MTQVKLPPSLKCMNNDVIINAPHIQQLLLWYELLCLFKLMHMHTCEFTTHTHTHTHTLTHTLTITITHLHTQLQAMRLRRSIEVCIEFLRTGSQHLNLLSGGISSETGVTSGCPDNQCLATGTAFTFQGSGSYLEFTVDSTSLLVRSYVNVQLQFQTRFANIINFRAQTNNA